MPDVTADPSEHMKNTDPLIGIIFFHYVSIYFFGNRKFLEKYSLEIESSSGQPTRPREAGVHGNP